MWTWKQWPSSFLMPQPRYTFPKDLRSVVTTLPWYAHTITHVTTSATESLFTSGFTSSMPSQSGIPPGTPLPSPYCSLALSSPTNTASTALLDDLREPDLRERHLWASLSHVSQTMVSLIFLGFRHTTHLMSLPSKQSVLPKEEEANSVQYASPRGNKSIFLNFCKNPVKFLHSKQNLTMCCRVFFEIDKYIPSYLDQFLQVGSYVAHLQKLISTSMLLRGPIVEINFYKRALTWPDSRN